jgi:mono/diheme cytochrome c family protein
MVRTLLHLLLLLPALPITSARAVPSSPPTNLYERQIQPILARNCYACHGDGRTSELDARTREGLLKGGSRGPALVPGKPEASRIYRLVAGLEKPAMPPTGPLPAADVAALKAWIAAGAPVGDGRWWAFRPVRRPAAPELHSAWVRNPIDAFLLARMRAAGVHPAPPASRETLIRRATYDLWGLPPTPEEIDAFVADRRPDAWERLIDRLLASPRYGERWARYWLDLARYAESEGFKSDEKRPDAWRYRDYVIDSLNRDKPYDRFLMEQIAGDELFPGDAAALVATGFNRHWADESNARNLRLRRQEILNDITDTSGAVFLGLTVGCARCHDHKYDPISQRDYYRLQAFFAAAQPRDDLLLVSPAEEARYHRRLSVWEARTAELRSELDRMETPVRKKLYQDKFDKFPPEVQEAITTAPAQRTALQWQLANKAAPQIEVGAAEVGGTFKGAERERWQLMQQRLNSFKPMKPAPLPIGIGVTDVGPTAPDTFTLAVGVYDAPLEKVEPGFPTAVDARPVSLPPASAGQRSTGRRAALAHWLASPENPLTARVMVNRLWQEHFGRGLAPTPSDFGRAGEPPSHPELLDWLASEFVATGTRGAGAWSLKTMHRLMMTSSTYRQSAAFNPTAARIDPANRLLWRMPRRRLEGEAIRDAMLSVSGRLNEKRGGPSMLPELPAGLTAAAWAPSTDLGERDRRSIYVYVKRNLRYPLFEAFDMPDTHESCPRREVTTTATQALMLLNDETSLRLARAFAGRLVSGGVSGGTTLIIDRAYRLAFGRRPDTVEERLAREFVERDAALARVRLERHQPLSRPDPAPPGLDPVAGAALVDFCHALMNASEFVYLD